MTADHKPARGPAPLTYVAMRNGQPTTAAPTLEAAQDDALRAELETDGGQYEYRWMEAKPDEWRLMRKAQSKRLVPAEQTARAVVAVPLAENPKTPVDGPIPVHVRSIPGGASLGMQALSRCVVEDVLQLLLSTDAPAWRERLDELAEQTPEQAQADEARGILAYEQLAEDMTDAVSSRVPLYGPAVPRLAAALLKASGRHVPTQRGNAA